MSTGSTGRRSGANTFVVQAPFEETPSNLGGFTKCMDDQPSSDIQRMLKARVDPFLEARLRRNVNNLNTCCLGKLDDLFAFNGTAILPNT